MGSTSKATDNGYMYKRSDNDAYLTVKSASGIYLNLENGQRILDATCGAAVSSLGHGDTRVMRAIAQQLDQVSYCHPGFFKTSIAEQLANFLVDSTDGRMARACITGSGVLLWNETVALIWTNSYRLLGSEAMEAAMKLARQYFLEISPQSPRFRFIAREGSWHGSTIATLAIGDFKIRKHLFEPLFADNVVRVSACHPFRGLRKDENTENYVARLTQELEDEFQRVGPETVCAFVAEPVVGTVSGVTWIPKLP